MGFSDTEARTKVVPIRFSPRERARLDALAAQSGLTIAGLFRAALDLWEAQFSEGTASAAPVVGSKKRPAASTQNSKAAGKSTPPNRTKRVQRSQQ